MPLWRRGKGTAVSGTLKRRRLSWSELSGQRLKLVDLDPGGVSIAAANQPTRLNDAGANEQRVSSEPGTIHPAV